MNDFHFTFDNLKSQFISAINLGYEIITCEEYYIKKKNKSLTNKIVVNRVDIDFSVKKADKLIEIFNQLGIKATFFLRLHAPEYNPFSFENYRIIKRLITTGHELGYHSEIIDQSTIWNEEAKDCLKRDLEIINKIFGIKVKGVASHGGMTGLNNLDFWKNYKPIDFGLFYEAYDTEPEFDLFNNCFYISDSEWTRWKCYDKGKLIQNDRRSFVEHSLDGHTLINLVIHPDTYFNSHFYDNEK